MNNCAYPEGGYNGRLKGEMETDNQYDVICTICLKLGHRASSCPDRIKFKNANGVLIKRALFLETAGFEGTKENIMYTLKDDDHKGYPSLYRLYMEMMDLTEYKFATTYFHSWRHWQEISEAVWFQPYITRWRTELEIKIKSLAVEEIRQEAISGGKNAFQANKWLIDRGWATPEQGRRGRPSKAQIKQELDRIVTDQISVEEDYKRIFN